VLVTFQFPIADARPFAPHLQLRLPLPDWPEPKTAINPQFVRYFGKACERRRDADEAWPDETKYCGARRGLRFDRLETHQAGPPNRRFRPRCAFRRLFCDGQAVVRVQIGVKHHRSAGRLEGLAIEELLAIIRKIAELPTLVPSKETAKSQQIVGQGERLARLYAKASMNRAANASPADLQLVEAGEPLILAELQPGESQIDLESALGKGLIAVNPASVSGATALFCRLEAQNGAVSTWIMEQGTATAGQLRSLRLCISRLHAEREVLDLILKQIHRQRLLNPPSPEAADLLDSYFNSRIKVVSRGMWGGMKQSEIIAAYDATLAAVRPASQTQLVARYEGCRRQVWKKIEEYQQRRIAARMVSVINFNNEGVIMVDKRIHVGGTGNIVNVAEYMSNVANAVNNYLGESNADSQVKTLLKELNERIERIAQSLEPSQAKKLGKNLEALSKEVANDEPERRWYEVSLEGLKEAAREVGEIASPILDTVTKLSALLLSP
jgi:hypothetical protein